MAETTEPESEVPTTAIERWCAIHQHRLVRFITERFGDGESVEDALQELWLGVILNPPPDTVVANSERLFAWLLVAARRRAVDLSRRERIRKHAALDSDTHSANECDAVKGEDADRVHRVMAVLVARGDESAARLLEQHYLDGQSVRQIAELLKISPRVVSARLQRAKTKFRAAWVVAGGG